MEIIDFDNVSSTGICRNYNGDLITDQICGFSRTMKKGNLYFLSGEIGSGNWAISCLLSGFLQNEKGGIFIDGVEVDKNTFNKSGFYLGDCNAYEKKIVRKILQEGLVKFGHKISIEELAESFELGKERIDSQLRSTSCERLNFSLALGYVLRKEIFCFPYIPNSQLRNELLTVKKSIDFLTNNGAFVIIPTSDVLGIDMIRSSEIKISSYWAQFLANASLNTE